MKGELRQQHHDVLVLRTSHQLQTPSAQSFQRTRQWKASSGPCEVAPCTSEPRPQEIRRTKQRKRTKLLEYVCWNCPPQRPYTELARRKVQQVTEQGTQVFHGVHWPSRSPCKGNQTVRKLSGEGSTLCLGLIHKVIPRDSNCPLVSVRGAKLLPQPGCQNMLLSMFPPTCRQAAQHYQHMSCGCRLSSNPMQQANSGTPRLLLMVLNTLSQNHLASVPCSLTASHSLS